MEVTEANLQLLAGYLQQTLSADPNVRRPGECVCVGMCVHTDGTHTAAHACCVRAREMILATLGKNTVFKNPERVLHAFQTYKTL